MGRWAGRLRTYRPIFLGEPPWNRLLPSAKVVLPPDLARAKCNLPCYLRIRITDCVLCVCACVPQTLSSHLLRLCTSCASLCTHACLHTCVPYHATLQPLSLLSLFLLNPPSLLIIKTGGKKFMNWHIGMSSFTFTFMHIVAISVHITFSRLTTITI